MRLRTGIPRDVKVDIQGLSPTLPSPFPLALCLAPIPPVRPLFNMPTYEWLRPVPVDLIDPEVFPMVAAARPCAASSSSCVGVCM